MHEYIFNNFELLFDYGEDKLLLNSKKIFREGIFDSIKLFNDSMMKNIQMVIREFKNNPDIEYYPNKAKLLEKIPTKFCKYDEVVEVVDSTLPRE